MQWTAVHCTVTVAQTRWRHQQHSGVADAALGGGQGGGTGVQLEASPGAAQLEGRQCAPHGMGGRAAQQQLQADKGAAGRGLAGALLKAMGGRSESAWLEDRLAVAGSGMQSFWDGGGGGDSGATGTRRCPTTERRGRAGPWRPWCLWRLIEGGARRPKASVPETAAGGHSQLQ